MIVIKIPAIQAQALHIVAALHLIVVAHLVHQVLVTVVIHRLILHPLVVQTGNK
ncbi:hypothetical protein [Brevibacillus laterosporus]|uniref:hypothetical protein n=1 Tax=Brevibacillus laterosporus TaxID=1465 RepID=UPI0013C3FA8E|nr:hypothetical protein [Brevibacillus laterosporus]MED1665656.1 hypothetical protein [Brevibacillus laterosporus]MED1667255.1 hypothetical protein [Brevibacillus laterosporus]MED1719677.1 hypothetical protein [Brevibacillus laterosporus]